MAKEARKQLNYRTVIVYIESFRALLPGESCFLRKSTLKHAANNRARCGKTLDFRDSEIRFRRLVF
jgi:hypothetical protein